jgi:hypothetical protein
MKHCFKFIVFACLITSSATLSAQQEKGDFQLQAQISINTSFANGNSSTMGTVLFNVSRFFTKNIEAGISPMIMFGEDFGSTRLAVFSNYSFLTGDGKFVPYAGAQLMVNANKSTTIDPVTFQETSSIDTEVGVGIRGGVRYFITEKVNIDAGPNLSVTNKSTLLIFNVGLGVLIGKR